MTRTRPEINTVAGKRKFIRMFMKQMQKDLLFKASKMPRQWDGHEIRWLMADHFAYEQHHRIGEFRVPLRDGAWRKRVKEYENETIVRNL